MVSLLKFLTGDSIIASLIRSLLLHQPLGKARQGKASLIPMLPDLFSCNVEKIGEPGDEAKVRQGFILC